MERALDSSTQYIFGLTGGIATGKSTVSSILTELGTLVIDADVIARDVVAPGSAGLAAIVDAFGAEVVLPTGALDRAALGEVIFSDDRARATLNAITHPRIAQAMMQRAAQGFEQGHPWVVYDAALLVENNIHTMFAALIVVYTDVLTQQARLIARDDLSQTQAQARLDAQLPLERKVRAADYVIHNGGTRHQTRARVELLHQTLCDAVAQGAPKPPERHWFGPVPTSFS